MPETNRKCRSSPTRKELPIETSPNPSDASLSTALLDASPDGLLLVDSNGVVRLTNRSAATIFGYEQDQLVGMSVEQLVPTELRDRHVRDRHTFARAPSARPMGTGLRLHGQHRDGDTFPVEISLRPITLGGDVQTVAAIRDVSERRETIARAVLHQDRERIAYDLHDLVIQRLFASGMSLQSIIGLVESPIVRDRVLAVIDELDETVRAVRTAILRIGSPTSYQSLAGHLNEIVAERGRSLGFTPDLHIEGPLDDLADHIADELVATLAEALGNIARHADATDATIEITRSNETVDLLVRDNGTGISSGPKPLGGLSTAMWRATELGGSCSIIPTEPSGTQLVWHVPI